MARICVQRGHCFRTKGATGTAGEQQVAASVGQRLALLLRAQGHSVALIGADDPVPASDAFVAIHCDGNANRTIRGASVGYPNVAGASLAAAWKRAHQRQGWPAGFHRDNYTANLSGYYGSRAALRANPRCAAFLAELGTTTNPDDFAWIQGNLDACARGLAEAIAEHTGARPVTEVVRVQPRTSIVVAGTIVDFEPVPGGGLWALTDLGAIYAFAAPDHDAPNRHPEYWREHRAAAFRRTDRGVFAPKVPGGYTVVATDGAEFDYGP